MDEQRLQQQINFCLEIDKEKRIMRHTYLSGGTDRENDAEHAWHMAVMALVLNEYSNEKIDVLRTVSMLLIHDLVEIYAGDTYAYDEQAQKSQKEREQAGADKLFSMLPDDQAQSFRALWEEFEAGQSPEACFAHTLDNFQPIMLNDATDGKAWVENGVALSKVLKRNENTALGSSTLWEYSRDNFIMPNVQKGRLINDTEVEQK